VDTDQVIVASITKTVTATALAQLVLTRKIQSLDDPVNRYLRRFQLPAFNGREVTLRDLATHAGGLDSPGWGTGVHDQAAIPASGPYLAAKIPHLVREPGRLAVYANFGPPIIGAVIEDVSGERFDRYVAHHILAPLGMGHSVINYAVDGGPRLIHAGLVGSKTPALALRMTNVPYAAPAGSLQATAPDMARYMLGHLGHIPDVIGPDLIALMQSPQHQNYPGLGRIGLSFFLSTWNGSPVVAHSGNIEGFKSNLVLVPTRDLGVFVSFAGSPVNGAVGARPDDATDSLLNRCLLSRQQ
jgi:CubicO group peptidase (beta-lactamase class C family)